MQQEDFPALYQSANQLSLISQRTFYRVLFWHLLFLITAAVISVVNSPLAILAILQALVLLGALGCSIYLFTARPDKYWHAARAVAESIKTISWRFASRAEPFDRNDDLDPSHFMQILKSVVEQNSEVAQRFCSNLEGDQLTEKMINLRQCNLEDRKAHYVEFRISDQHRWYAKKSIWNRDKSKTFFIALIATNSVAVIFAILKISFPSAPYWPTDVLIAMAAGILSWTQAKRFSELASAYALAVHEISLIKEQSVTIKNDKEFSCFVSDAENAFSREHTQWVARKDI
jgi:hypothetical protein